MSDRQGWWRLGACYASFDLRSHAQSPKLRAEFRQEYCMNCLIRKECSDWAAQTNQLNGVWGGVTRSKR